jgi:hypothetical protein
MIEGCVSDDIPKTFQPLPGASMRALFTHAAETPHVATALVSALTKHIECKTRLLKQQIRAFESKWDMSFEEFAKRTRAGKIRQRFRTWDVESDFRTWEQTENLLKHYKSLQVG